MYEEKNEIKKSNTYNIINNFDVNIKVKTKNINKFNHIDSSQNFLNLIDEKSNLAHFKEEKK